MVKVRENWIDWAKTILIFLMVLGHNHISGVERVWIYGFHMPAFFIISGYLYKPRDWKMTLKSFVVPIAFYSVIRFCFYLAKNAYMGNPFPDHVIFRTLVPLFKANVHDEITLFSGIWFLVCLLFCRFICGDIYNRISKNWIYVFSIICFAFMAVENWIPVPNHIQETYLYRTIACVPFFTLGMFWKKWKERVTVGGLKMAVLFVVIYTLVVLQNGYVEFASGIYGMNYSLTFIIAVLGSYALFSFCNSLKGYGSIQLFSTGTILILGFHKIILNLMAMFISYENLYLTNIMSVVETIIVMAVCYLPIKYCVKNCPILLGK